MKKKIVTKENQLAKFQNSEISAINSIYGGVKSGDTTTSVGRETHSSATDADTSDLDCDAL